MNEEFKKGMLHALKFLYEKDLLEKYEEKVQERGGPFSPFIVEHYITLDKYNDIFFKILEKDISNEFEFYEELIEDCELNDFQKGIYYVIYNCDYMNSFDFLEKEDLLFKVINAF